MVCKGCGTDGSDPRNKLCIQADYTVPYCWDCMKIWSNKLAKYFRDKRQKEQAK